MMTTVDGDDPVQVQLLAFRRDTVPSFEAMVREYCRAETISDDVASILEDIGQDFVWLSELVNHEIKRRRDAAADGDGLFRTKGRHSR